MSFEEKLVVFKGMGISYIGKLAEEPNSDFLKLKSCIMMIAKKDGQHEVGSVPYASRDSLITVPLKQMPGVIIDNPEKQITEMYNKEIVSCYSNLTLVNK